MATQLSGLRDEQYRALEIGERVHLVGHDFPGGECWALTVISSFLAAGKPGVKGKREDGRTFKLNRYSAGVHFPDDCPFHNIVSLRQAS